MNGRAVAIWTCACLLAVLVVADPLMRLLVLAAAGTVVVAGAGRRARGLLATVGVVALLTSAVNFVASHLGATVFFVLPDSWPVLGGAYTLESIIFGLAAGLTLAGAVMAVAPLSLLLEPYELLDALPAGLARTGVVLSASLNLVPAVARSFRAVAEAQRLRGWRPGLRTWPEVLVPVLLTAIEDSVQLAEAMEARGYGSGPRTRYVRPRWRRSDSLVGLAAALAAGGLVALRVVGLLPDWGPYPRLTIPTPEPLAVVACLLLCVPALVWRSSRASSA